MSLLLKGKKGVAPITLDSGRATVGTRSTCRLTVDDPMVAEEHLALTVRDGAYFVEDLRTSSGTYLDGLALDGEAEIPKEGKHTIVFGVSKFLTAFDEAKGVMTLTLKEQSFWYDKKEDPLKWSRSEVTFGRFRPVKVGNWVALALGAAVVGLCFLPSISEPLVEPGAVAEVHTHDFWKEHRPDILAKLEASGIAPEDCNACHDPYSGTPPTKCAPCHESVTKDPVHPPSWEGQSCQPCHVDHRDGVLTVVKAEESCSSCHGSEIPEPSQLAQTRTEEKPWVALTYDAFPHDKHLTEKAKQAGVANCETCHERNERPTLADFSKGQPQREYGRIKFKQCQNCHHPEAELESIAWEVKWHGAKADDGGECQKCHEKTYLADLRQVERAERPGRLAGFMAYQVMPRDHHAELTKLQASNPKACSECHRDEKFKDTPVLSGRPFVHGVHLTNTNPQSQAEFQLANQQCIECHQEVVTGGAQVDHLTQGHYAGPAGSCDTCHDKKLPVPSLRNEALTKVMANDFPHGRHLDVSKAGLQRGCLSCHNPAESVRDPKVPFTTEAARSCTPCHEKHDSVGGGECDQCHTKDDIVWTQSKLMRKWPAPNSFSHASRGHDKVDCAVCHLGTESAKSLSELTIPVESDESCRKCHIEQHARFHWR